MTQIKASTLTNSYTKLLQNLFNKGTLKQSDSSNPTARDKTLELQGVTIEINDPTTRFITEPVRDFSKSYFANELLWYMSGEYNVNKVPPMKNVWEAYTDEEGNVRSNYGAKIFHEEVPTGHDPNASAGKHKQTQWELLNELITKNPDTRRAVGHINLFGRDSPHMINGKDFPCNVNFQLLKEPDTNELNMHIYQRSCDAVNGYCYDIPWFATLQEMFAREQDMEVGRLVHHTGSMHIYGNSFDKLAGMDYKAFEPAQEQLAAAMTQEDVDNLIENNFKALEETPWGREVLEHADDFWTDTYTSKPSPAYRRQKQ